MANTARRRSLCSWIMYMYARNSTCRTSNENRIRGLTIKRNERLVRHSFYGIASKRELSAIHSLTDMWAVYAGWIVGHLTLFMRCKENLNYFAFWFYSLICRVPNRQDLQKKLHFFDKMPFVWLDYMAWEMFEMRCIQINSETFIFGWKVLFNCATPLDLKRRTGSFNVDTNYAHNDTTTQTGKTTCCFHVIHIWNFMHTAPI